MDVRQCLRLGFSFALLAMIQAGCSQKSADTVFPESTEQASSCGATRLQTRFLVQWENGDFSVLEAENKESFIQKHLNPNINEIRHVEFDKLVTLKTEDVQGMAYAPSPMDSATWGQAAVEVTSAWSQGFKGQSVLVGVVDAAVDYDHPQLAPRLYVSAAEFSENGADDDQNGYIDDFHGWDFHGRRPKPIVTSNNKHGSHVAGIIAADHASGDVPGLAPSARIIPANFMDSNGGGSLGDAILAINYVAARGAKVINASWGGEFCSTALRETIASLESRNILFVVASGNSSLDLDYVPEFPAAFSLAPQITVAATRSSDRLAAFSNTSYHYVHLAAPGDPIYSTVPGGYDFLSGTSMAAPFVSGAAAILWSARPTASLNQIKAALLNSVDVRDYRVMTRGRLNIRKAIDEIKRLVP